MNDATAARRQARSPAAALDRRRLLQLALALPAAAALAGCGGATVRDDDRPDPLIALADAALRGIVAAADLAQAVHQAAERGDREHH